MKSNGDPIGVTWLRIVAQFSPLVNPDRQLLTPNCGATISIYFIPTLTIGSPSWAYEQGSEMFEIALCRVEPADYFRGETVVNEGTQ